jgi:hypothetical protein
MWSAHGLAVQIKSMAALAVAAATANSAAVHVCARSSGGFFGGGGLAGFSAKGVTVPVADMVHAVVVVRGVLRNSRIHCCWHWW